MHIPSPAVNGFHLGPVFVHYYGLMYVIGITLAILITQRRWQRMGGDPGLVGDVALWAVPAGIIGGRIYFDITTPNYIPHHWYGIFAVWDGGLGIWGGIALGAAAGIWRVRRHHADAGLFADAVAPALLVAQAIGRIGNYFNKELFGGPTSLPWGLYIPPSYRPPGYLSSQTFQPTFLYELIFDLALAAALIWLGHHRGIKAPGLFALYVTGYSAFRIFEESLRVDPSEHFLGLRLNMYVAIAGTIAGGVWFWYSQRYGKGVPGTDGAVTRRAEADAEAPRPTPRPPRPAPRLTAPQPVRRSSPPGRRRSRPVTPPVMPQPTVRPSPWRRPARAANRPPRSARTWAATTPPKPRRRPSDGPVTGPDTVVVHDQVPPGDVLDGCVGPKPAPAQPPSTHRQNGCPAGSAYTRKWSPGWTANFAAPAASTLASAASGSSTRKSRCICMDEDGSGQAGGW